MDHLSSLLGSLKIAHLQSSSGDRFLGDKVQTLECCPSRAGCEFHCGVRVSHHVCSRDPGTCHQAEL